MKFPFLQDRLGPESRMLQALVYIKTAKLFKLLHLFKLTTIKKKEWFGGWLYKKVIL